MKMFLFTLSIYIILIPLMLYTDYSLLFQSQAVTGIDGYYYILQIETFRDTGNFYFATKTPLILYYFSALSYLFDDPIMSLKFGALILEVLLCAGVAALLYVLTKNILWCGLGVLFTLGSVLHLFFLIEFLNNLGALALFVWCLFGVVKFYETKNKIWGFFAAFMCTGAMFSHRSGLGLTLILLSGILLVHCWMKRTFTWKHQLPFALLFFLLLFLPLVAAWQPFFTLPKELSSEFLRYPHNPFRALVLTDYFLLLITSLAVFAVYFRQPELFRGSLSGLSLLFISLWFMIFSLNPFLNHQNGITGIVARLDSVVFVKAAIAAPLLLSKLILCPKKHFWVVLVLGAACLALRFFLTPPLGARTEFLDARQMLVSELPAMRAALCEKPLIVAKHNEQFLVTYLLKIPSQQNSPLENNHQCVYWLVHQPKSNYRIIFDDSIASRSGDIVLVGDEALMSAVKYLPDIEKLQFFSDNPHVQSLFADPRH